MKFSVGDRVLMKRTGEEGIITAFLSKQLIEVAIGDICFPVYEDEIDHPYFKWFTDPKKPRLVKLKREIPVEKEAAKAPRLSRGIYLSFLPQFATGTNEDIIDSFGIHLLNETADHLTFSYHARTTEGTVILSLDGTLHPFANIFLHTIALSDLNGQPRFHWSVASRDKPLSGFKDTLRIRPAQLIRYIATLLQDGAPSFSILLTQDAEAIPATGVPISSVPVPSAATPEIRTQLHTAPSPILDLHIDALDDAQAAMNASEILATQLRLLEQKLDAGYIAGLEKMIVIHGIGAGSLRKAIHDLLRQTSFVSQFSNHWMPLYGWGATEISFGKKS